MPVKVLPFLVCRLIACYFFFLCLTGVLSTLCINGTRSTFSDTPTQGFEYYSQFGHWIADLLIAALVWFKAEKLSSIIAGKYAAQEMRFNVSAENIQIAGFTVVALFVLTDAINPLSNFLNLLILRPSLSEKAGSLIDKQLIELFLKGVKYLFCGFGIFFAAPWFVQLSKKYNKDIS